MYIVKLNHLSVINLKKNIFLNFHVNMSKKVKKMFFFSR